MNFVFVAVAQIEQRVAEQHFRRAGISLERQRGEAEPQIPRRVAEQMPRRRCGLTIRRQRFRAVFRAIPPLEHKVIRVAAEVGGVAEDDVFVENIVGQNCLDGAAIAFALVHFDDVQNHGRAAEGVAVIFRHRDVADLRGVRGIEEVRIGNHREAWSEGLLRGGFRRVALHGDDRAVDGRKRHAGGGIDSYF